MKSIQKTSKRNKKGLLLIAVVAIVLLGLGVGVYAFRDRIFNTPTNTSTKAPTVNTPSLDPPTSEQQDAGDKAKEDFINNQDNPQTPSGNSTITISSNSLNGGTYQIRTIISEIDDNGSCTLTMTADGKPTITQTVGTQTMGSYSVCKGFDISSTTLGNTQWLAKVEYKGAAGSATTQKNIKVE